MQIFDPAATIGLRRVIARAATASEHVPTIPANIATLAKLALRRPIPALSLLGIVTVGCGAGDENTAPEPEPERTPAQTFCSGSQQCNAEAFDEQYDSYDDCVRSLDAFIDDHFQYFSGSYGRDCAVAYSLVGECYIANSACFLIEADGEASSAFYGPDGSCLEEDAAMRQVCVRE